MVLAVAIAVLLEVAGAAEVAPARVAATQAPAYGPVLPVPPRPKPVRSAAADSKCASARASAATASSTVQDIIVCAPPGYRLNPDVIAARKGLRSPGRPVSPHEPFRDTKCVTIGPMGCRGGATINLVNAAMVAATMVSKAVKGENVGQMFVTGHEPTEYQLYLEAKAAREAKEAAAKVKAKAAVQQQAAATTTPTVAQ